MRKENKKTKQAATERLVRLQGRIDEIVTRLDRAGAIIVSDKFRPLVNGLTLTLQEGFTLRGQHLATIAESWTATLRMDLDMGADIRTTLESRDADPVEALRQIRLSEEYFTESE